MSRPVRLPVRHDFPVHQIRRYLEPGPIVLVSSAWKGERNIMTLGWHIVMEFSPALIGCVIAAGNHSFGLIRRSRECVINLPTVALLDQVVAIGNCSGAGRDKFADFGFTAAAAAAVGAPLIAQCHASFECRLYDGRLIGKYNYFIFEVLKAHVARTPKNPKTIHYKGDGEFMVAGEVVSRRSGLRAQTL